MGPLSLRTSLVIAANLLFLVCIASGQGATECPLGSTVQCDGDGECGSGSCDGLGNCVPSTTRSCNGDGECGSGSCNGGTCVPSTTRSCNGDGECGSGACDGMGTCAPSTTASCQGVGECGRGSCDGMGTCSPSTTSSCDGDGECGSGSCDGIGTCDPSTTRSCDGDGECGVGSCDGMGTCVPSTTRSCDGDGECGSGSCDGMGTCVPSTTRSCQGDGECGRGSCDGMGTCDPSTTVSCTLGSGDCGECDGNGNCVQRRRRLQAGDPNDDCACPPGSTLCDDPHMQGLRGQRIDWSGVDGAWYCLIKDTASDFYVNVRLTAPMAIEFPKRQLVTGMSVLSEGHSLVIEVVDPYSTTTNGCRDGLAPCVAYGGIRVVVDGREDGTLLHLPREVPLEGGLVLSASNLPVECTQFGGERAWAKIRQGQLRDQRMLRERSFEDWVLSYTYGMAASEWCTKYIAEEGLALVQSDHAVFRIDTPVVPVRLSVGINHQVEGEIDWDGSVLPDLDFWQMDLGLEGLVLADDLSGILGETARPVLDANGVEVMEGLGAIRGTVEDYRVLDALGKDFALLHKSF